MTARGVYFMLIFSSFFFVVRCADDANGKSRDELIEHYFLKGFKYAVISKTLQLLHNLAVSLKTIKRVLSRLNLRRKQKFYTDEHLLNVIRTVQDELKESGKCLGYRSLWRRLRHKGLVVSQQKCLQLLHILDEEGVICRKKRRLRRRQYVNPGPDFAWHMDGYDKLKPYGFPIHGCIDGYSRRVLWLEVGSTNNNPLLIATYYVQAALRHKSIPCVLRADRGTENGHVKTIQVYLRSEHDDELSGENSFVYGKSTGNQRIESFWGQLRRHCVQFWMDLFKDMVSTGQLDTSNKIHMLTLRYCFLHLIRKDLYRMSQEWNVHPIRRNQNAKTQAGKPDLMYYCPEMFDTTTFRKEYNSSVLNIIEDTLANQQEFPDYPEDYVHFVEDLIGPHDIPLEVQQGSALYRRINVEVQNLEAQRGISL